MDVKREHTGDRQSAHSVSAEFSSGKRAAEALATQRSAGKSLPNWPGRAWVAGADECEKVSGLQAAQLGVGSFSWSRSSGNGTLECNETDGVQKVGELSSAFKHISAGGNSDKGRDSNSVGGGFSHRESSGNDKGRDINRVEKVWEKLERTLKQIDQKKGEDVSIPAGGDTANGEDRSAGAAEKEALGNADNGARPRTVSKEVQALADRLSQRTSVNRNQSLRPSGENAENVEANARHSLGSQSISSAPRKQWQFVTNTETERPEGVQLKAGKETSNAVDGTANVSSLELFRPSAYQISRAEVDTESRMSREGGRQSRQWCQEEVQKANGSEAGGERPPGVESNGRERLVLQRVDGRLRWTPEGGSPTEQKAAPVLGAKMLEESGNVNEVVAQKTGLRNTDCANGGEKARREDEGLTSVSHELLRLTSVAEGIRRRAADGVHTPSVSRRPETGTSALRVAQSMREAQGLVLGAIRKQRELEASSTRTASSPVEPPDRNSRNASQGWSTEPAESSDSELVIRIQMRSPRAAHVGSPSAVGSPRGSDVVIIADGGATERRGAVKVLTETREEGVARVSTDQVVGQRNGMTDGWIAGRRLDDVSRSPGAEATNGSSCGGKRAAESQALCLENDSSEKEPIKSLGERIGNRNETDTARLETAARCESSSKFRTGSHRTGLSLGASEEGDQGLVRIALPLGGNSDDSRFGVLPQNESGEIFTDGGTCRRGWVEDSGEIGHSVEVETLVGCSERDQAGEEQPGQQAEEAGLKYDSRSAETERWALEKELRMDPESFSGIDSCSLAIPSGVDLEEGLGSAKNFFSPRGSTEPGEGRRAGASSPEKVASKDGGLSPTRFEERTGLWQFDAENRAAEREQSDVALTSDRARDFATADVSLTSAAAALPSQRPTASRFGWPPGEGSGFYSEFANPETSEPVSERQLSLENVVLGGERVGFAARAREWRERLQTDHVSQNLRGHSNGVETGFGLSEALDGQVDVVDREKGYGVWRATAGAATYREAAERPGESPDCFAASGETAERPLEEPVESPDWLTAGRATERWEGEVPSGEARTWAGDATAVAAAHSPGCSTEEEKQPVGFGEPPVGFGEFFKRGRSATGRKERAETSSGGSLRSKSWRGGSRSDRSSVSRRRKNRGGRASRSASGESTGRSKPGPSVGNNRSGSFSPKRSRFFRSDRPAKTIPWHPRRSGDTDSDSSADCSSEGSARGSSGSACHVGIPEPESPAKVRNSGTESGASVDPRGVSVRRKGYSHGQRSRSSTEPPSCSSDGDTDLASSGRRPDGLRTESSRPGEPNSEGQLAIIRAMGNTAAGHADVLSPGCLAHCCPTCGSPGNALPGGLEALLQPKFRPAVPLFEAQRNLLMESTQGEADGAVIAAGNCKEGNGSSRVWGYQKSDRTLKEDCHDRSRETELLPKRSSMLPTRDSDTKGPAEASPSGSVKVSGVLESGRVDPTVFLSAAGRLRAAAQQVRASVEVGERTSLQGLTNTILEICEEAALAALQAAAETPTGAPPVDTKPFLAA